MSGRSESRSETPRSENQEEIDKPESNNEQLNHEIPKDILNDPGQAGWGGQGSAKMNPEQKWASGEGSWGQTKVNQTNFDWSGPDGGPPKPDGPPAQARPQSWSQDSGAAGWSNQGSNPPGWNESRGNQPSGQPPAPQQQTAGWGQSPQQQQQQVPPQQQQQQQRSQSQSGQGNPNWPNSGWGKSNEPNQSAGQGDPGSNSRWNDQPAQVGSQQQPPPSWSREPVPNEPSWSGGSQLDTPTSQGDSWNNIVQNRVNEMHTQYAQVHNLDEATQKLINSNEGWGKKPVQQQVKWNIEGIVTETFSLDSVQDGPRSRVPSTTGSNGTEWWEPNGQGAKPPGVTHSRSRENRQESSQDWNPNNNRAQQQGQGGHQGWGGHEQQQQPGPPSSGKWDNNRRPWNPSSQPPAPPREWESSGGGRSNHGYGGPANGYGSGQGYGQGQPPGHTGYPPRGPQNHYPGRPGMDEWGNQGGNEYGAPSQSWGGPPRGGSWGGPNSTSPGQAHPSSRGGSWGQEQNQDPWNRPNEQSNPDWNRRPDQWNHENGGKWGKDSWDDRFGHGNGMVPSPGQYQPNVNHNRHYVQMASQKGLIPPNIVNEPTFSNNPHLGQICKALIDETEKKNKLHLEMQSAYQRRSYGQMGNQRLDQLQNALNLSTSNEQQMRNSLNQLMSNLWSESQQPKNRNQSQRGPAGFRQSGYEQQRYPPDWSDKNKEDKNPEIVENLGKLNLKDKSERGEKSGLPETGPPPFVPGEKWTGNVEKPDLLDPSKNPDLTPATMEQIMRNRANRNQGGPWPNYQNPGGGGWDSQAAPGGANWGNANMHMSSQQAQWGQPSQPPNDSPANPHDPNNLLPADIFSNDNQQ